MIYRTLRNEEQDAVIDLWVRVLDDTHENRRRIFYDFGDDPQRFARTQVALLPDGTVCAAVSYWVRRVYGAQGQTYRIGHVWGAATHSAFRKHGLATALIERCINAMRQEGCIGSILFARDEARSLYERLGWQAVPTLYRGGLVMIDNLEYKTNPITNTNHVINTNHIVLPYDPFDSELGWQPLAEIYAAYNRQRPLSLVRTEAYWHGYLAWMAKDWITQHCATYLTLTQRDRPNSMLGYALVHFYDKDYAAQHFGSPPWFHISEIAVREQTPDMLLALLRGVALEAVGRDMGYGHFALPEDPITQTAIDGVFAAPLNEESVPGTMMIRTIAGSFEAAQFDLHFKAPGALCWEIDRF